ncbi:MAG TPA: GNAT family N-acetyltransferase/peptidase C39 family protein [Gammaproteobacteria bacterium]|nr:GNAT family N-acetyltransferase/peptidase C39 family protein [Gammaproteobacteria bacterium]
MIRSAAVGDIDALVGIENRCFETDRLSRRSFRHMLTRANAATLVDEGDGMLHGYVMVLFHSGTSMARLYSIAVDPSFRGQGLGARLVGAAEETALEHDCAYLRLEVRRDNPSSIDLFKRLGYRQFGRYTDYYQDHMEALRFEKQLGSGLRPDLAVVPYYEQTLDFTCGPASLMMAMKALQPDLALDRRLEIRLWRESTTVFMTSGHGGCGPYGLALSAYHRGFDVQVYVNDESALFIDSVRSAEKKEVIRLTQDDFLEEVRELPIALHYQPLRLADMKEEFEAGGIPVVLISSYRIYHEKSPHWVVVTGFDRRFVHVHDPYVDYDKGKTRTDSLSMPISQKDFERMARYGKSGQRAALIIRSRGAVRPRGRTDQEGAG